MTIFNSYVKLPEGNPCFEWLSHRFVGGDLQIRCMFLLKEQVHASLQQMFSVSVDPVRLLGHALDDAPQVRRPINSWSIESPPPTVLLIWPVVI